MARRGKKRSRKTIKASPVHVQAATSTAVQVNKDFSEDAAYTGMVAAFSHTIDPRTVRLLEEYSRSPWLRSVVDRVSSSFSMADWKIYKKPLSRIGRRNYKAIKKQLDTLNLQPEDNNEFIEFWNRGNKKFSGFTCRRLIQQYIDLVGECYIILDFDKKTKKPIYYSPVPPDWVEKTGSGWRDGKGKREYLINIGLGATKRTYKEHEVVHLVNVDPYDPYKRSSSISSAIRKELALDTEAASYATDYFHNGMMPTGILTAKGANKTQVERMREEWENRHRGGGKRHKIHITGAEIDYTRTEQEFSPDNIVNIREFERNVVMQVYGVPPEILGILDKSNRATIQSAEDIFAKMVILPRLRFIQAEIQEKIVSKYFGDDLYLDFYSPLPADTQLEVEVMKFAPYAFKINEFRALARKKPLSKEEGGENMGAILDIRGQAEAGSTMRGNPQNDQSGKDESTEKSIGVHMLKSGDLSRLDKIKEIVDISAVRASGYISKSLSTVEEMASDKAVSLMQRSIAKSYIVDEGRENALERLSKSLSDDDFWLSKADESLSRICLLETKEKMYSDISSMVGHSSVTIRKSASCSYDHKGESVQDICTKSDCRCVATRDGREDDDFIAFEKLCSLNLNKIKQEYLTMCKNYMELVIEEVFRE